MTGSVRVPSASKLRNSSPDKSRTLHALRIRLRELRAQDAQAFVDSVRVSRRLHGRWVQPPGTIAEFLTRMEKRNTLANSVSMIAVRVDDDAIVGAFNLSEIIRGPLQQAFLGYYAFAPHGGQGYMREGMKLILIHAFDVLELHRIEANIQPGNERSIALARAAGFVREGFSARYLKIARRWRDHERWAINADMWRAGRRGSAPR